MNIDKIFTIDNTDGYTQEQLNDFNVKFPSYAIAKGFLNLKNLLIEHTSGVNISLSVQRAM